MLDGLRLDRGGRRPYQLHRSLHQRELEGGDSLLRSQQQARLNPRYFYESFSGLDELLVAVFDRIAAEAVDAVLQAVSEHRDDPPATARATIGAFVELMTADPRKGRVAFVEAMGSEALMRRRLDTLQQFAELVSEYARETYGADAGDEETAQLTAQMLVGGLTEALIAWLEGRLHVSRDRLVEHSAALFIAAAKASAR